MGKPEPNKTPRTVSPVRGGDEEASKPLKDYLASMGQRLLAVKARTWERWPLNLGEIWSRSKLGGAP